MNAEVNAVPESGPEAVATAGVSSMATRPFYWSVRRELWEHRALFIAPLVPAGIVLLFMLLGAFNLSSGTHFSAPLPPEQQRALLGGIFGTLSGLVLVVAAATAFFYCLDALHGERRDRSILFWKSLPVSDLTAVLAKLFIPAVAVPVIALGVIVATQLVIMLVATVVLLVNGISPLGVWSELPFVQMAIALVYVLAALALWLAPVYGWLLLVSAWARRSTFLWAVMPPLAVGLLEKMVFGTDYFWALLRDRFAGGFAHALAVRRPGTSLLQGDGMSTHVPQQLLQILDPVKFLSSPALWIGLGVAAVFIAAAVWMRRYREPL
jgi:ABC-2 type transport system permease protein